MRPLNYKGHSMKKAQREKLAATQLQRHVRGWRVRTKYPLAKWRKDRALRKALVPEELLRNIDNSLKAYVLQDASSKFFFPAKYDQRGRNAVLDRARQLGFDCGEESNAAGKTVAFVQRPPESAGASVDASVPLPTAADTLGDSPERATTVAHRTASASASAPPPAAESQTTARAGSKAKARWRPLDVGGDAGGSTEEDSPAWGRAQAAPAEPPRPVWTAEAVPPAPVWKAEAVPGRKAAQELAEMTGYPIEGCMQVLEDCNFDSNAAANVLLSRGPPSPKTGGADARPTLPAPLSNSIPAPAPPPLQQQSQRPRTPDALTELTAATAAAKAAEVAAEVAAEAAAAAAAAAPAAAAAAAALPPATLFRVSHTLLSATLSGGSRPGGGTLQMRVPSTAESRRVAEAAPLLLFDQDRRQLHGVFAASGSIGDDGVLHFRPVKPHPLTAPQHPLITRHTLIAPHTLHQVKQFPPLAEAACLHLLEYVDGEPRPTLAPAAVKQLFEVFNKQAPVQHAACAWHALVA